MIDKKYFFNSVRGSLFNGKLLQSQVDGMNVLLDNMEHLDRYNKAYILATAYHETGGKMVPVSELGLGKFYAYGKWHSDSRGKDYCFTSGSRKEIYFKKDNPNLYYGRGIVQLTWLDNYKRMTEELRKRNLIKSDVDLVKEPELANDLDISTNIIILGMVNGFFTGKKLEDYINNKKKDYIGARRVVNGKDRAEHIASICNKFEKALGL